MTSLERPLTRHKVPEHKIPGHRIPGHRGREAPSASDMKVFVRFATIYIPAVMVIAVVVILFRMVWHQVDGLNTPTADAQSLGHLQRFDMDGDNVLSRQEFSYAVVDASLQTNTTFTRIDGETIDKRFNRLDINGDNKLTGAELKAAANQKPAKGLN